MSTSYYQPATSSPHVPAGIARTELLCKHPVMTRLFDGDLMERCAYCYRSSEIFYQCTQDHGGFLPNSNPRGNFVIRQPQRLVPNYDLSHSMTEAANKGCYTKEELAMLKKQKAKVAKTLEQINQIRPSTASSASTARSYNSSIPHSATYSTLASVDNDTDDNFYSTYSQARSPFLMPIQEGLDDEEEEEDSACQPRAKLTRPYVCNFKLCNRCGPGYSERTFDSINRIMNTNIDQLLPPPHELQNRRISEAHIVAGINGTRAPYQIGSDTHGNSQQLVNTGTMSERPRGSLIRSPRIRDLAAFERAETNEQRLSRFVQ